MVFKGEDLCDFCFKPINTNHEKACTNCGLSHENYKIEDSSLLPGTILSGRYIIGRILGSAGFENTYLAYSAAREETVVVKEYYPIDIVNRAKGEKKLMF